MSPDKYYPEKYLADFNVYRDSFSRTLELCPLVLGNSISKGKCTDLDSVEDFFVTQYCFNLLSQGIKTYYPDEYKEWKIRAERFLDVQGCHSHSFRGGSYSRPIDLLQFLRDAGVEISQNKITEYVSYLFSLIVSGALPSVPVNELCRHLLSDTDCLEAHSGLQMILDNERER